MMGLPSQYATCHLGFATILDLISLISCAQQELQEPYYLKIVIQKHVLHYIIWLLAQILNYILVG